MDTDSVMPRLVVGSWPGRSFGTNNFIAGFCDALEAAGCEVVEVSDPRKLVTRVDVLHIHWPEQVFWAGGNALRLGYRTLSTLRALAALKRAGTRLVWMVHNLRPHDASGMPRLLWPLLSGRLASMADGFMTLSPATVPVVQAAFPQLADKPVAAAWHPRYPAVSDAPGRAVSRQAQRLPLDGTLYAFLGLIKRYKGVLDLVRVFTATPDASRHLVVAGGADSAAFGEQIVHLAASDARIDVRLGRLSEAVLFELARAADVIVLPFRDYLHSGSMIYALSSGRPVITPSTPFADGLAAMIGPAWVRTYAGSLKPADLDFAAPDGAPDLSSLSWTKLGDAAAGLYRTLVRSAPGR